MYRRRVPLAWLNLTENKTKLLASVGAVAFSVLLIFVELGFMNGVYDSQTLLLENLNADLIMVHAHKVAATPKRPFPRIRLEQARAVGGVTSAYPVYMEEDRAWWKNREDGREYPIRVLAFDPHDPVFLFPEVKRQADKLLAPDTALIDSRSNDYYGPLEPGATAELNLHRVRVVGVFSMGPNFRVDGNLIVSDRTFFKSFYDPVKGRSEINKLEFGLIKVAADHDPAAVQRALAEQLPRDVAVYTKRGFIAETRRFWGETKAVGQVFGLGAIVGFLIGMMICYQILFAGVLDRMPQYATLKAIGYSDSFLFQVVLQEALYLSVLGFLPGLLVSHGVYVLLRQSTGLVMELTLWRTIPVFLLTLLMCAVAGLIAAGKSLQADPAELF